MTFFKKLINILEKKQLHPKNRYKFKKVDDFFLSQKIRFIYK